MSIQSTTTTHLLDIEQASTFLNVKISRMRSFVFRREIPFIKVGRLIRFDVRDLEQWINNLKDQQKFDSRLIKSVYQQ